MGAIVAVFASFLPWLRSGEAQRTSYETLGLVHRLGFAPTGIAKWFVEAWPVMPALLAVGVVTAWWGWRIVAATFGGLGGLYAAILGAIVAAVEPTSRQVDVSVAPAITAIGGLTVIAGSVLCVVFRVPSADANSR